MRRLLVFAAVSIALSASDAKAGSITLSTTFAEGMASTIGSHDCNTSTSSDRLLSQTCGHTLTAGVATGHFSGTGFATVDVINGLGFHASSDLSVWVTNSAGTAGMLADPGYFASLNTAARLNDSVAVQNAGAVQSGFVRFTFDVGGSVSRWYDQITLDGFDPTGPGPISGQGTGSAALVINSVSASFGVGRTVVLDVPLAFSGPQGLDLSFFATARGQIFSTFQGVRVLTDFAHTATLTDTVILDGDKNLIAGATLVSQSGVDYRTGPQAVPEPASVALVSLGLIAILVRRRKLARR